MLTNKIFNASALEKPISSAAQQLLCACITADMRSPNSCCASGYQLVGDIKKTFYPPSGRLAGDERHIR